VWYTVFLEYKRSSGLALWGFVNPLLVVSVALSRVQALYNLYQILALNDE
jgi:hypothetical protein